MKTKGWGLRRLLNGESMRVQIPRNPTKCQVFTCDPSLRRCRWEIPWAGWLAVPPQWIRLKRSTGRHPTSIWGLYMYTQRLHLPPTHTDIRTNTHMYTCTERERDRVRGTLKFKYPESFSCLVALISGEALGNIQAVTGAIQIPPFYLTTSTESPATAPGTNFFHLHFCQSSHSPLFSVLPFDASSAVVSKVLTVLCPWACWKCLVTLSST